MTGLHLFFVDTAEGVQWYRELASGHRVKHRLVAVSAEALEAARAAGIECEALADLIPRSQAALAGERPVFKQWLNFLGKLDQLVDCEDRVNTDTGEAFSFPVYLIALAVNAVRYRAGLMKIAACEVRPQRVTVLETRLDPMFDGAGYASNPWTLAFDSWAQTAGMEVEVLFRAPAGSSHSDRAELAFSQRVVSNTRAWARHVPLLRRLRMTFKAYAAKAKHLGRRRLKEWSDLKVLFCDAHGYDWQHVQHLMNRNGAKLFFVERDYRSASLIDATYHPLVTTHTGSTVRLPRTANGPLKSPASPALPGELLRCLEDPEWQDALRFDGIETLRPLVPYLKLIGTTGRHRSWLVDRTVRTVLDCVQPSVVCFFAIASPYQFRMVYECRRRRIPVVCYQHGGAYGTHEVVTHDFVDNPWADIFLSYGKKIFAPSSPLVEGRSKYVPIGSARLQQLAAGVCSSGSDARRQRPLRVIWAGDISMRNTTTVGTEIEDTTRYQLETQCLAALAKASDKIEVIYRPFPGDLAAQATPAWIRRTGLSNVRVVATGALVDLLRTCDLVLTISTSGTLWNEALALGIPLVAYLNPEFTRVRGDFAATLEDASLLCRSDSAMLEACERLASEGSAFLNRFQEKNSARFLRDYVLDDSDAISAAAHLLHEIGTGNLAYRNRPAD